MFIHQIDRERFLVYCYDRKGYYIDALLGWTADGRLIAEEELLEAAETPDEVRFAELVSARG